ncbi:MAG: hypothetical protein KDD15_03060 [Lewinella sp.]|nr:hypothetical protein [Lewinella sp.]
MFIPPNKLAKDLKRQTTAGSSIRLQSSHLLIDREMAQSVFGDEANVHIVYYPDRHSLLLAPVSDETFKNLHKTGRHMLKDRNLQGDKSVALHEILIDHQVDDRDRDLAYEFQAGLGILNVQL